MHNFIKNIAYQIIASLSLISSVYAQSSFNEQDLATPNNSQIEVTKLIDQTQNNVLGEKLISEIPSTNPLREILEENQNSVDNLILNKEHPSLMFSYDESVKIKEAVDSYRNDPLDPILREEKLKSQESNQVKEEDKNENQSNIYLASILFLNQNNWAVWINNEKINSENNNRDNELFIKSISKNDINLIWQMSISKWKILSGYSAESNITPELNKDNKVEVLISLKPNQTFILKNSKIIEGKLVKQKLPSEKI